MNNEIAELFYNALGILIPALCLIAIELLRRKLGLEKMRRLQRELQIKLELAALAVKMVEQSYRDLKGPDKYNEAANWLMDRSCERGIKVSPNEIRGLIEAALRITKDEFGEQWANSVQADRENR